MKVNCSGTVLPNHNSMPHDFGSKTLKIKQCDIQTRMTRDLTAVLWKDKRKVYLRTHANASRQEFHRWTWSNHQTCHCWKLQYAYGQLNGTHLFNKPRHIQVDKEAAPPSAGPVHFKLLDPILRFWCQDYKSRFQNPWGQKYCSRRRKTNNKFRLKNRRLASAEIKTDHPWLRNNGQWLWRAVSWDVVCYTYGLSLQKKLFQWKAWSGTMRYFIQKQPH